MMEKNSGAAQQILKEQPKALPTHCHGHSLSLSIKDASKQCRILNNVMGAIGEITVLIKFSPKREKMLGAINKNIAFSSDGDDDDFEHSHKNGKIVWKHGPYNAFRSIMLHFHGRSLSKGVQNNKNGFRQGPFSLRR